MTNCVITLLSMHTASTLRQWAEGHYFKQRTSHAAQNKLFIAPSVNVGEVCKMSCLCGGNVYPISVHVLEMRSSRLCIPICQLSCKVELSLRF
jgi:hypothetical protein